MNKIIKNKKIAKNTHLMQVHNPQIATKARPGNFVILRINEKGERIPLTISDYDEESITLVFLKVGRTTKKLSEMTKGDEIKDFLGPLGNESDIKKYGKVCLIAGGVGAAVLYPLAKELKKKQNNVTIIIGAKSKEFLFWEDRFKKLCDRLIICTDDGSRGRKGFVSEALEQLIKEKENFDLVFVVGPTIMMKVVADITRGKFKTIASLNPIMIDGTGMCGGCRVSVDNRIRFACVEGPDFDAHKVDFNGLINRNKRFVEEESY